MLERLILNGRFSGNTEPKSIIEHRGGEAANANDIFAEQNEVEEPELNHQNSNNNNNGISFVTMVIFLLFHLFIRFQFLYALQLTLDVLEKEITCLAYIVNQIHRAWKWPYAFI